MITQLELGNIRLFDGIGEWKFPITQLSVLCGTNSAGKSTILKCLLLLLQNHDTSDVMSPSGQLRLAGPLVDLGSYESFVSHRDISKDILIGIVTHDFVRARAIPRGQAKKVVAQEGPDPEYVPYKLNARFRFGLLESTYESSQSLLAVELPGNATFRGAFTTQAFLKEASFEFETDSYSLSWTVAVGSPTLKKGADPDYEIFIPADYFGAAGGHTTMDVPRVDAGTHVRIEALLRGILPIGLWTRAKRRVRSAEDDDTLSFFPLPRLIREITNDLSGELNNIRYLGPLRSPGKRFYLTNLDATPRIDAAGDFLPYILRDRSEAVINYFQPRGDRNTQGPLRVAVNEWLFYLRTGESRIGDREEYIPEIYFTSVREVLLEFTLQSFGGESHALADSGFGYSQLLPIVVAGLLADYGQTIAIEQPEVHLNPGLQVRMAEFLQSLASAGKTILIETHSEHIINTFRVLAAERPTGTLSNSCSILFLDTERGMPLLRRLEINDDGNVPEWPRNFMGEAMHLSSRLLRAQQVRFTKQQENTK